MITKSISEQVNQDETSSKVYTKKYSASLNGTRFDTLNVGFNLATRSMMPEKKTFQYSPSAKDGSYDFSTYNSDNRVHYNDRTIVIQLYVTERNRFALERKKNQLMQLLFKANDDYVPFVLDTAPNTQYMVKLMDCADSDSEGIWSTITATFTAKPFPTSVQTPLIVENYDIVGNDLVIAPLSIVGTYYTRPKITLTGSFTKFTIEHLGKGRKLVYSGVSSGTDTTVIDFELENVTKNGVDYNEYIEGDYFELAPNVTNGLKLSATGTNCSIKVEYVPYYLYSAEGIDNV